MSCFPSAKMQNYNSSIGWNYQLGKRCSAENTGTKKYYMEWHK